MQVVYSISKGQLLQCQAANSVCENLEVSQFPVETLRVGVFDTLILMQVCGF